MTTPATPSTQNGANINTDSDQAAKLRRVLSVAEPKKPAETPSAPATSKP